MHFCHSDEIWTKFPRLSASLLIVDDIHPQADAEPHLQPLYERARELLRQDTESQIPAVSAWRRAYSLMGLKPTKYRSAAEALLRRFKREDDLPRLHPLVDLCNAMSLAFALPVAALDLDRVDGFIEVRPAEGTEKYLAFNNEIETPAPGEVIFADAANQVHARRWTFRQSRLSTINPETKKVLIISEGLHDTAPTDVPGLIDTLAGSISELWTAPRYQAALTAQSPRLEFN